MDKLNSLISECIAPMEKIYRETIKPINDENKTIVCSHWLKGKCIKGSKCTFLHRYGEDKLPHCKHFLDYGFCDKPDCPFKHEEKQECEWYMKGFCKHGNKCKNGHKQKLICPLYFMGFCPFGKECKFEHPSLNNFLERKGDGNEKNQKNEKESRNNYVNNEKKPKHNYN